MSRTAKSAIILMMVVMSVLASHHNHPMLEQSNWNVQGTVNIVREFEGLRLTAYVCPAGVLTIGYGHTGADVFRGQTITAARAEQLLTADLQTFANCVNGAIRVPLNANQRGALVSFSFNVGCGALRTSTLVTRLNAGQNPNTVAAEELPRWNRGGGQVLPGLTRRRTAEVNFFRS